MTINPIIEPNSAIINEMRTEIIDFSMIDYQVLFQVYQTLRRKHPDRWIYL